MFFFRKPAKRAASGKPALQAMLFDTFGTTVDWFGSMTAHGRALGQETGIDADWEGLTRAWRARYQPAIKPVREGKRRWTGFDVLLREELDRVAGNFGAGRLSRAERARLTAGWSALAPWPDVPGALRRLGKHFLLGPLSNGTTRQMIDLARYGHLPWSVIFGADMFQTYKPAPALYRGAVQLLGLHPEQVLLVAAHNQDLQAAQKQGLRTCFVHRSTEDQQAEGSYDFVVDDFEHLARTLNAV